MARVRVVRLFGMVFMAVVPQFGLVEQEEKYHADQQRGKQVVRSDLAFKRLRQQVHEGSAQQRTGRQAEHVLGVAGQHAKAQQRRQPDTANAGSDCPQQNCR